MAEKYIELREQLKQESPELYDSLMRSWKIADEKWLSAISGNKGCFNATPHIRNHERYANIILKQAHESFPESAILHMSPIEKYLLLAAMLFHDIGRSKKSDGHAYESKRIIDEHFGDLGIEDKAIANLLADICKYHDCKKEDEPDLKEHSISPYGIIHTKRIAVLLKFIDNLDGAYTRVYPYYLKGDPKQMIEGVRRNTGDIRVDINNHMVVTSPKIDTGEIYKPLDNDDIAKTHLSFNTKEQSLIADVDKLLPICSRNNIKIIWNTFKNIEENIEPSKTYDHIHTLIKSMTHLVDQLTSILIIEKRTEKRREKIIHSLITFNNKTSSTRYFIKKYISHKNKYIIRKMNNQTQISNYIIQKKIKLNENIIKSKQRKLSNFPSLNIHHSIKELEQIKLNLENIRNSLFNNTNSLQCKIVKKTLFNIWNNLYKFENTKVISILYKKSNFNSNLFRPNDALQPHISLLNTQQYPKIWTWPELIPHLIIRKIIYANPLSTADDNLINKLLCLAIAGNVRSSNLLLNNMRTDLSNFGIPLDAWLLEIKEHLFVSYGMETFEPSLSKRFLKEVIDAMWRLSACIFSTETYSYQTLAAKLRITDIDLVRTAVRRICIVTRHIKVTRETPPNSKSCYTIGFTENEWRWNLTNDDDDKHKDKHDRDWVIDQINSLVEPWQEKEEKKNV